MRNDAKTKEARMKMLSVFAENDFNAEYYGNLPTDMGCTKGKFCKDHPEVEKMASICSTQYALHELQMNFENVGPIFVTEFERQNVEDLVYGLEDLESILHPETRLMTRRVRQFWAEFFRHGIFYQLQTMDGNKVNLVTNQKLDFWHMNLNKECKEIGNSTHNFTTGKGLPRKV